MQSQQRNFLTRMIRARKIRIIAVICRDAEKITAAHQRNKFPEPRIKVSQRLCITLWITTMPIQHIKIDKIRHNHMRFRSILIP